MAVVVSGCREVVVTVDDCFEVVGCCWVIFVGLEAVRLHALSRRERHCPPSCPSQRRVRRPDPEKFDESCPLCVDVVDIAVAVAAAVVVVADIAVAVAVVVLVVDIAVAVVDIAVAVAAEIVVADLAAAVECCYAFEMTFSFQIMTMLRKYVRMYINVLQGQKWFIDIN